MSTELDVHALVADRLVEIEGTWNFRDLGGYPTADGRATRWGVVFRADGIHRLGDRGPGAVASLGIRTVVDLRTVRELDEQGSFPTSAAGIEVHHRPLIERTWMDESLPAEGPAHEFLARRYLTMATKGGEHVAATLRLLSLNDRVPLVFHCAAGKDRTGVTAALLLALLGVDDETIAIDYGLSRAGVERLLEWLREHKPEVLDAMVDQPASYLASPPAAMLLFLDAVRDQWGSIEGWADAHGLDDESRTRLRANLLD